MNYLSIICFPYNGKELKERMRKSIKNNFKDCFFSSHENRDDIFERSCLLILRKDANSSDCEDDFGDCLRSDDIKYIKDDDSILFIYEIDNIIDSTVIFGGEDYIKEFMQETAYEDIKCEFDSLFKDAQKILKKHKDTPEKISKTEFLLDDLWDKEPENIDMINMITRWDPVSSVEWESGFEELEGFTYAGLMEICEYK